MDEVFFWGFNWWWKIQRSWFQKKQFMHNWLYSAASAWRHVLMPPPYNIISYLICRGPNAHYLFHLLAHFKRGDCDGIKVRLGRLQEFIQTACIEHLDFLSIDPDLARGFQPFQEKDMGKQFQSLTDIPKVALTSHTDTWLDYKVGGMGWWERDTYTVPL